MGWFDFLKRKPVAKVVLGELEATFTRFGQTKTLQGNLTNYRFEAQQNSLKITMLPNPDYTGRARLEVEYEGTRIEQTIVWEHLSPLNLPIRGKDVMIVLSFSGDNKAALIGLETIKYTILQ